MEGQETPLVHCPKCNSTQISADKKGFSGKKALIGGLLTGGIGLLAGTIGSKDIIITCLNCGYKFMPGEGKIESTQEDNNEANHEETPSPVEEIKGDLSPTLQAENSSDNSWLIIIGVIVVLVIIFFIVSNS